jgi:hypothetical protein
MKVFGRNIVDARVSYDRLMAEAPAQEAPIDWYTCPNCGKSVDIGSECPVCANDIPFMGEPVAVQDEGNGLAAGVDF